MQTVIEMQDVYKIYQSGEAQVYALNGVSFSLTAGEFAAIVGRSGSGKSTLMNVIGCLDFVTAGAYRLNGENIATMSEGRISRIRNRQIGFIFQNFHLLPTLTALENVELPLIYAGVKRSERRSIARRMLEQVGLCDRMHHYPAQMSGGQQQRVAIARAIAGAPPLILADEPTGNLDEASGADVMTILQRLHQNGTTILLITHDATVAAKAQRRLQMRAGRLYSL